MQLSPQLVRKVLIAFKDIPKFDRNESRLYESDNNYCQVDEINEQKRDEENSDRRFRVAVFRIER